MIALADRFRAYTDQLFDLETVAFSKSAYQILCFHSELQLWPMCTAC